MERSFKNQILRILKSQQCMYTIGLGINNASSFMLTAQRAHTPVFELKREDKTPGLVAAFVFGGDGLWQKVFSTQ